MQDIQWGMIGTGAVTERKSGPALMRAEHSVLRGVTNRTLAKAEDWARRHGVDTVYASVDAMLADPAIDIVYIATPPDAHLPLTQAAAAAGKHVYVEKPMALDAAGARAMMEACDQAGVRLFVAYYRRAMPRFQQVRIWLREGRIGTVCSVSVTLRHPPAPEERSRDTLPWRVRAEVAGGGRFLDVAVHTLDLLDDWFGPIDDVAGFPAQRAGLYDVEDTVTAAWRHRSGVTGTGSWCFVASDSEDRVEIIGTDGRMTFSCFGDEPLVLQSAGERVEADLPRPTHVHQPLVQAIVDELRGGSPAPSTGMSALRTTEVADRVLRG